MNTAEQWRQFARDNDLTPTMQRLAEQAALECERVAAGEPARCLCCRKPFGSHPLNFTRGA